MTDQSPTDSQSISLSADQCLRGFFVAFYFLSSMLWCFPFLYKLNPKLKFFVYTIAVDLTGSHGFDVSYLALNLKFLKAYPYNWLIFGASCLGCVLLLQRAMRAIGATVLLVAIQAIAYSLPGRAVVFDIVSYSFFGYWLGLMIPLACKSLTRETVQTLPWFMSLNVLGVVYTSACFAKLQFSGFEWANSYHVGLLLQDAEFRFNAGASPRAPASFLLDFFLQPNSWSTLLLSLTLALEGLGICIVLLKRWSRLYLVALIGLHVGMFLFTGIFFRPNLVLLAVFAFPFPGAYPTASRQVTILSLSISLIILGIGWTMPTSPMRDNVGLIWPVSRFNMFAWGRDPAMSQFYLRNKNGRIIRNKTLIRFLQVNITTFNLFIMARLAPDTRFQEAGPFICKHIAEQPRAAKVLLRNPIQIWVQYTELTPTPQKLKKEDVQLGSCEFDQFIPTHALATNPGSGVNVDQLLFR